MFGTNVFKGLWVTAVHYFYTYWQDLQRLLFRRPWQAPGVLLPGGVGADTKGYMTVQYPDEKMPVPERFRFYPMLLYESEGGDIRCTSCGICAKVCPPQCIWIMQSKIPAARRSRSARSSTLTRPSACSAAFAPSTAPSTPSR